jgi:hypothetical protein
MDDYVSKPIDGTKVLQLLQYYLPEDRDIDDTAAGWTGS